MEQIGYLVQPQLNKKLIYDYYRSGEILFSANLIKCGKDIFFLSLYKDPTKGKGTEQGLNWYKQQLPEFTFNEVPVYLSDGKIALIKPDCY